MLVMLRNIVLVMLMIGSFSTFAHAPQQASSLNRWVGHPVSDDWISSWVVEHFAHYVDRDVVNATPAEIGHAVDKMHRPSAGPKRYRREHVEAQELDRIKATASVKTGWLQRAGNLADENLKLLQQLEATRTVLTILDEQATEVGGEREILAAKAEENRQRVVELERELSASHEKSYQADLANEKLKVEIDELRQGSQHQVDTLESKLSVLEKENEQLRRTNEQPTAKEETLQPQSNWVARLLGYHRGYIDAASQMEISAEEEWENKALTKRLETALGQGITVPDLAALGMVFVGGHVTPINGAATGRIVYQDTDGNQLEFWLAPRRGQSSSVNFGQSGELNIVHWQGANTEYALIGSVAWEELAPIAGKLHQLSAN